MGIKLYKRRNFGNWHLLTGTKGGMHSITKQNYYASESLVSFSKMNAFCILKFILADKTRHILGI